MSDELQPACENLLDKPDNIEIIRDQIAALLAVDFRRQAELATEAERADAGDYNVAVYVESDAPLQYVDDYTPGSIPFPCVNVSVDSTDEAAGTASVNKQSLTAQIYVDAYAAGNDDADGDFEKRAALRAWKTARLVRNILRAEKNTYLRLRGVVGKVAWKFQAGEPSAARSAVKVRMVRITLAVDYVEDVAIEQGVIDWDIAGLVTDENGRVLFGDDEKEETDENGDS